MCVGVVGVGVVCGVRCGVRLRTFGSARDAADGDGLDGLEVCGHERLRDDNLPVRARRQQEISARWWWWWWWSRVACHVSAAVGCKCEWTGTWRVGSVCWWPRCAVQRAHWSSSCAAFPWPLETAPSSRAWTPPSTPIQESLFNVDRAHSHHYEEFQECNMRFAYHRRLPLHSRPPCCCWRWWIGW